MPTNHKNDNGKMSPEMGQCDIHLGSNLLESELSPRKNVVLVLET